MPMVKKLLFITLALAVTACRTDLFFGKVLGVAATVYAPNGRTPVYRAEVVIEDLKPSGYYGKTVTSAAGEFLFQGVPDGLYRVGVTSPNGLFETTFHAEVEDGYTPGGVEVIMAPARAGTFVNVPGRYDDMGAILTDLGYLYKTVGVDALAASQNPLGAADVLCLNSGVDPTSSQEEAVVKNLRSFVENGGRLIASDQAWPFVKAAWPEKVDWSDNPAIGNVYQDVEATFVDGDLKKCATVPKWRLEYNLSNWAIPNGTTGTVFIRGAVETSKGRRDDAPLLIGFRYGRGFVAFSTFDWRTQYGNGRLAVRVFNYLVTNN
jgi:hypothetical protein